jgi:hypothetical protein
MRICSILNVLDFGAVLTVGTPAEIRADDRVKAAYLGTVDDPEEEAVEHPLDQLAANSAAGAHA